MHKVLIVSPHFPPINAPDHQRVRLALPYFKQFGWEPTILSVAPEYVEGLIDPVLERSLPPDITILRCTAVPRALTRRFGFGGLGWRAMLSLHRFGRTALRDGHFDLIFFSTTVFPTLVLGPVWRRSFGVPYVLDFQDPWFSDFYRLNNLPPPGGKAKYWVNNLFASLLEGKVIRGASHLISVSQAYLRQFHEQYPDTAAIPATVLPFGASARDFSLLTTLNVEQQFFQAADGMLHAVYVGRGGLDMQRSLSVLFAAVRQAREALPEAVGRLRFHFIGTSYNISEHRREIETLAATFGVSDIVDEHPRRVPYFEGLKAMTDAAIVLVFGSSDKGYNPSKVYPCLLSARPILAVMPSESPAVSALQKADIDVVTYSGPYSETSDLAAVAHTRKFLETFVTADVPGPSARDIGEHSAEMMTRRLCEIFSDVLARQR